MAGRWASFSVLIPIFLSRSHPEDFPFVIGGFKFELQHG
jgi:hypothetical protein